MSTGPTYMRFERWTISPEVSLSALLPQRSPRMGIYVLEFADGEEYVGQTTNLTGRFADHRRHWPDPIVGLRFAAVPQAQLDRAEQDVVARLRQAGKALRNKDLVDMPLRSDAMDPLVSPDTQVEWLRDNYDVLEVRDRSEQALQRIKNREKYSRLANRADYDELLQGLCSYVRGCLPAPDLTERAFWSITALPATGRSSEWRRLAAITVNNVEVLVLGEVNDGEGWRPQGFMNVGGETEVPWPLRDRVIERSYRPVGRVLSIEFDRFAEIADLLSHAPIRIGARRLALGLLRKGKGMFSRFHNYLLADDIFVELLD